MADLLMPVTSDISSLVISSISDKMNIVFCFGLSLSVSIEIIWQFHHFPAGMRAAVKFFRTISSQVLSSVLYSRFLFLS